MNDNKILALVIVGFVMIVGLAAYLENKSNQEWQAIAKANDCVCISETDTQVIPITGFDSKGNATFSNAIIAGTKTYHCKDGKTYVR